MAQISRFINKARKMYVNAYTDTSATLYLPLCKVADTPFHIHILYYMRIHIQDPTLIRMGKFDSLEKGTCF